MQRLSRLSFFLLLLLFPAGFACAQQAVSLSDKDLLLGKDFTKAEFQQRNPSFLLTKNSNVFVRYNPVSLALGSVMYIYQNVFSTQISAGCMYSPSCSGFSKQLISEYGIIKGVFLSADRITRCNRISGIDLHPLDMDDHDHKVHEDLSIYRLH
ncbi:MAG: membrane protein insertion efficiency factor YidD [Bacteroidota bacterium]